MLSLPPTEHPSLSTNHLVEPQSGWQSSLHWFKKPHLPTLSVKEWRSTPVFGFALGTLLATSATSTLAFQLLQPNPPALTEKNESSYSKELASAQAPSTFLAQAETTLDTTTPSPSPLAAELVSAPAANSPTEKVYAYQVVLAQGFLKKAVDLSQQSRNSQTENQRTAIMQSLDQALQAVNKAIELDPTQGAGFLIRARIYKTATVLQPELAAKSEQDLLIARTLGVNSELLGTDTSALELLPTEQAQNLASAPVIADAEEGTQTNVTSNFQGNALSGKTTLAAGQTLIQVAYPELKATQSLRVDVIDKSQNPSHILFSIVNRVDGQGFTIQASRAPENNIDLEWRAIHE